MSDLPYQFDFRHYRRRLAQPLRTAHGEWREREGVIIRLTDSSGAHGYGEIAPIPSFGSETLKSCHTLCSAFGPVVTRDELLGAVLPCVRFAIGSALAMLAGDRPLRDRYPVACLLPHGPQALDTAQERIQAGHMTFKLKIIDGSDHERQQVEVLLDELEATGGRLRVDANGGLDTDHSARWLRMLARHDAAVDYIEQPMRPGHETEMQRLMEQYGVQIALDESITGPKALQQHIAWPGILVVKPALAGDPAELRDMLAVRQGKVVYSSALETVVGVHGALLAVGDNVRPLGFGLECWEDGDRCSPIVTSGHLDAAAITPDHLARVWSHIGSS